MSNLIDSGLIKAIKKACLDHVTLTEDKAKRFFKVSKGSYADQDQFLGVTVPNLRKISKIYQDVSIDVIEGLLESIYNEERLLALLILVGQYNKGDSGCQDQIAKFYLSKLHCVNNWNLVDSSAHFILGDYLWDKDRSILVKLAKSDVLWDRRISIVTTWYFIRKGDLEWTFKLAKLLKNDSHDLIHKAVGWMLREAGKKDEKKLISFLAENASQMPKTMLRYALERLSQEQKLAIPFAFKAAALL